MRPIPLLISSALLYLVSLSATGAEDAASAEQRLAFDHIWIHAKAGAPEAKVLIDAGLQLGPMTKVHTGMGTASRFFFFGATCLELIWVEDPEALRRAAPEFARTLLGGPQASPFGIGLRWVSAENDALPFETMPILAEWIRPGNALHVARTDAKDAPAVPPVFVVPSYMALAARRGEFADLSVHRRGLREITRIRIHGPGLPSDSAGIRFLILQKLVEFVPGRENVLELEFDGRSKGGVLDARPVLPLVIRD